MKAPLELSSAKFSTGFLIAPKRLSDRTPGI